jgi:predicted nuclease with TOPRIM domain
MAFKDLTNKLFHKSKKYTSAKEYWQKEADNMAKENLELLKKVQELDLEKAMIRKLCFHQEQENNNLLNRAQAAEEQYKDMKAKLDLYEKGLTETAEDIKALTIVPVSKDDQGETTFAPVVITLNKEGTQVKSRVAKPDTLYKYALDNAKISFMELFDLKEVNVN